MVRNNHRLNPAALAVGIFIAMGIAVIAWLASGFSQSLATNTAVPNAYAATLPPGFIVTDSHHRVCDSSGYWLELEIRNESGISDHQLVENLPGVRHSGLGDIAASLYVSADWLRLRQPCTYFYFGLNPPKSNRWVMR